MVIAPLEDLIGEKNQKSMIISLLNQSFGDERGLFPSRQEGVAPDVTDKSNRKVIIPEKFKADVKALEAYTEASISSGLCIKISLAEIYAIVPRKRRRIDSYKALTQYLEDELNVKLIISSNKSK